MFLDRSWPIRGGAADNRNRKISYNEVFYSYRKKGPR